MRREYMIPKMEILYLGMEDIITDSNTDGNTEGTEIIPQSANWVE